MAGTRGGTNVIFRQMCQSRTTTNNTVTFHLNIIGQGGD
jgi:hypothetical protein